MPSLSVSTRKISACFFYLLIYSFSWAQTGPFPEASPTDSCRGGAFCDSLVITTEWTSSAVLGNYAIAAVGDLDQDGVPEIVSCKLWSDTLFILDGATGNTIVKVKTSVNIQDGTTPAIGDVDNDGFGEIIIIDDNDYLYCYDHLGSIQYTGPTRIGYSSIRFRHPVISLADFDGDGMTEILVGNQVYNGQNGNLIASGGQSNSQGDHPLRPNDFPMSVAIDALSDSACAACSGQEIVAGNMVYSVDINASSIQVQNTALPGFSDGFTSIVDYDRDGDLDAVVQGRVPEAGGLVPGVYIWDIQTSIILDTFIIPNSITLGASRVTVANLDADPDLEMTFSARNVFYALDHDLTVLWTYPVQDVSSGITPSTVFDFCGDGTWEVLYRDEDSLRIFAGNTGNVLYSQACESATHVEYPIIADVDGDDETEILISCGPSHFAGGFVCLGSGGDPWVPSRKVWNQHGYFYTHINDDLTIPAVPDHHHLVGDSILLNKFLVQPGLVDSSYNPTRDFLPDAVVLIDSVECDSGPGGIFVVYATICNIGDTVLPATTPVALYNNDPTATSTSSLIAVNSTLTSINSGACSPIQFLLSSRPGQNIYVVANDNGSLAGNLPFDLSTDFPVTSIIECDYTNNLSGFFWDCGDSCDVYQADFSWAISGSKVVFTDLTTPNTSFSNWDYGDGISGTSLGSGSQVHHYYASNGSYQVCLESIIVLPSEITCKDTICKTLDLMTVSIEEGIERNVSIFPNPVLGEEVNLSFYTPPKKPITLKLLDVFGREVLAKTFSVSEKEVALSLKGVSCGVYMLLLDDGDQPFQMKLIKK